MVVILQQVYRWYKATGPKYITIKFQEENEMSKLKIKTRGISMEVVGKDDLIQREREAFLEYAENHKGIQIGVTAIPVERLRPFPEHMNCKCSCDSEEPATEAEDKQEGSIDFIRTVKQHRKMNWEELAEKIKKGIIPVEVGATVSCELADGTPAEFVVTDVTEQYVRFETRNFIGGEVEWNEQDTNKGGYPDSDIRGYIDSTIWGLLPEDLQVVISDVDREWKDKDGNCGTYTTKLFLPAASEVFDEDSCYGDKGLYKQLDYYKDARNRIRVDEDGDTRVYWLASVGSGNSTYACGVYYDGYASNWDASNSARVPVCFQISKIS